MDFQDLRFLILRTLDLDRKTLLRSSWMPLRERLALTSKKYVALATRTARPFRLGSSHVTLGKSKLYYNSAVGSVGGYQAVVSEHMYWIQQLEVPQCPVVMDVGANVGYVSRALSTLIRDVRILAFEPSPSASAALLRNCTNASMAENFNIPQPGEIILHSVAVNSTGLPMILDEDPTSSAFSTTRSSSHEGGKPVQGCRLDDVASQWIEAEGVWLLKLDVEGNEMDVLRGASRILRHVKYLHIELNSESWAISDLFAVLAENHIRAELVAIRNFSYPSDGIFTQGDALFALKAYDENMNVATQLEWHRES